MPDASLHATTILPFESTTIAPGWGLMGFFDTLIGGEKICAWAAAENARAITVSDTLENKTRRCQRRKWLLSSRRMSFPFGRSAFEPAIFIQSEVT